MAEYKLWIDGEPVEGFAEMGVINPATETFFTTIARSNEVLVDQAVESARRAQQQWKKTTIPQRQQALVKLADTLQANAEELAKAITLEQGKPLADAHGEVAWAEAFIRAFANLNLDVKTLVDNNEKQVNLYRQPLGVVACIVPWNFPFLIASFKVPNALLAGNSCILKPAPTTPISATIFARICAQVLPHGLVNTVIDQNDMGQYITEHPGINKVSFTGSTATGKRVMASAAGTLKRITLEMGGNDAAIVLPDVDVKEVAQRIYQTAFMNCGQVCLAIKRVYAHESIYDELCTELTQRAEAAVVGDGMKEGVQLGPVNNRLQYEKVLGLIESASLNGKVLCGGKIENTKGYFIRPVIVRDVKDGDAIVDQEQFGPVLPVIAYQDVEQAIMSANRLDAGLGGSVWSKDLEKAKEIAQQMESGTVWINSHLDIDPNIPFVGAKQSGIGAEFGMEGLLEFTQIKVINCSKQAV